MAAATLYVCTTCRQSGVAPEGEDALRPGAVLFAALVLLGLVRPALKGAARPRAIPVAGGTVDALEAEQPERPALPAPTRKDELLPVTPEQMQLEDARRLAKENPMAVAKILKTWVNGDPV